MSRVLNGLYERLVGQGLMPFYETRLMRRSTFRYWREFEADQWRSPEEIAALQWRRLQALLRHADQTVPHYQSIFRSLDMRPEDIRTPADFARLPILEKAPIRQEPERFLSTLYERPRLVASTTGGSTGDPMRFYYDRSSYERRVAAAMRGDGWAGWRLCAGEFYIWGMPVLPQAGFQRHKRQLHHAGLRRQIVSSFELSPERIEEMVRRYNHMRPRVVVGYANPIYEFARYAQSANLKLYPPVGVISSAEKLYGYQREVIEAVFGAPVFDRYGSREVMLIAAECEQHDGLHVTADNLYVELVADGKLCEPGERGEVLLTDLHNYGMPFIRYKLGDVATWRGKDCPCGRGLPLLNVVEGRILDLISTPNGRIVPGEYFVYLLKDFAWIRRYQVVQDRLDTVVVRIATEGTAPGEHVRTLEEAMLQTLGPGIQVRWEMGPDVEIEYGRKFRPVHSHIPPQLQAAGRD